MMPERRMRHTGFHPGRHLTGLLLVPFLALAAASAASLDDQIAAFKNAPQQSEEAVDRLLKTGLEEGRAAEALAAVRPWLTQHPSSTPTLLFHAGRAMEYVGDWSDAVSFYRKLLKLKSLDPALAGAAVRSTYRLLLNGMRDTDAAYLLMREDGNRLRVFQPARPFDAWFMDEARRRGDLPAYCSRLAAMMRDPDPGPAIQEDALEWVCGQLESFKYEEESWYAAALDLAAAPRVPEAYKARLQWAATVMPYNHKLDELRNAKQEAAPELTNPPLAAAERLLKVSPDQGAILVARGWGSAYDGEQSANCEKRFNVDGQRKLAQLWAALPNLSPDQRDDLLACPIAKGRVKFEPAAVRKLVAQYPGMLNSLSVADVPLYDKTITLEEAKALAPQLARNPHVQAALVRAYAAAEAKTFSKMVPALIQSELWRFDDVKPALNAIWNSGVERSGDFNKTLRQYQTEDETYARFSKRCGKEATSQDRLAAFAELRKDLLGPAPSIRAALTLWDQLWSDAPDADGISMLKTLTSDLSADGDYLLRRALGKTRWGKNRELSFTPEPRDTYSRTPLITLLPELAAHLEKVLRDQLQAGAISETILGMWLHCANPKKAEAVALVKDLAASPAYAKVNAAYRQCAADSQYFGAAAQPPTRKALGARQVSRELLELKDNAPPEQVEAALEKAVARLGEAPAPVPLSGLHPVAGLPKMSEATRARSLSLFEEWSPLGDYPTRQGYEQLALRLIQDLQRARQWGAILPYTAGLWRCAGTPDDHRHPRVAEALLAFAEAAMEAGHASAAISIARSGLNSRIDALTSNNEKSESQLRIGRLRQLAGKANMALGVVEIPVDATDPAYGIYKSSAEFVQGNLDSAWKLYESNADQLQSGDGDQSSVIRKLPLDYCFWLLRKDIDAGQTERAEVLVKALTIWSRQAEGTFSLEQEADLKIAYADLAFRKGALPTARAWYRKVADAQEYRGSLIQLRAALGSVKVDRVSKNFAPALEELDKLMRIKDPSARMQVHYARAEVLMDQENYKEAADEIDAVLRYDANHADALILRGKIQYQMRKLVEASEIELGVSQREKVMVPGETLKINLLDPTLSVSGIGADIEVEVWAQSGDRERLMLHQLGDSKEKFRAEVATSLAPPVPGDKTLQVLGVDAIRFGYSKRFRDKMKDLPPDPDVVIGIASDAQLSLSAGAFPPREGERKLDITELDLSSAQRALGTRAVRPGNPIYLRVIDPDQSKTADIDQVVVTVQSSSGDVIRRMELKETGPFTGEFEGIVPTAGAQALAFASESAPDRDPNMAISAKPYPGWLGKVGNKEAVRTFGVDLNDNVPLDKMSIQWGAPDQALTHFVLQTSMNGLQWTTRARYPDYPAPWDGHPRVSSFPTYRGGPPVSVPTGRQLPADWLEKMELTSAGPSCEYLASTVTGLSAKQLPMVNTGHPGYSGLLQYRALFYQPSAALRRFRLDGYPAEDAKGQIQTIFLLDGEPAGESSTDPLLIERELAPGLHEIQVWCHEGRDALLKRKPVLLCDVEGKDEWMPCPDAMFDPATFPKGVHAALPKPAKISKAADTGLDVAFGEDTSARLVRLVILGFEGVAPAIKSVTLSDRSGKMRLPVEQDFMALRQNTQLEVLPGDQITARYEDTVTATPGRGRHERHLTVAFNTAKVTASFLTYTTDAEGHRDLILEPIRRFRLDDPVGIVIEDPDMDTSPEKDVVEFVAATSDGTKTTVKAVETEEHSAVFVGRIFPVAGKPARPSEIQVTEGAALTATYRDMENLDPGIPTDRSVTIEHAQFVTPELGLYTIDSESLPPAPAPPPAPEVKSRRSAASGPEVILPRCALNYSYVDQPPSAAAPLRGVLGASLHFDVVVPHLALAASSEITAYVQTDAGRKAAKGTVREPFDIDVPGTLKLTAHPAAAKTVVPRGYTIRTQPSKPSSKRPLDEGRFSFSVPLILGDPPTRSFANQAAESLPSNSIPDGLIVRAGDTVHVGYAYKDPQGQLQWKTAAFKVVSHAFLDVMDGSYGSTLNSAFVGERVHVRVLAPGLDRSPERDVTTVALKATSGAATAFQLKETEPHSGLFKGVFALSYADQKLPDELPPVELNGFPVRYGDEVLVSSTAINESPAQSATVSVNTGANGRVEPFSKRFTGDEMAVKTSFTLAECFFELAKKHRQMDQESLARREIGQAQKLLAEAIATHREDEMRAHAEYLLGNLSQEFADLAKNDAAKLPMYQDALARFSKIPLDYPESEFAPKAQFKTALVYEKMGEIEIAVEEYVKLAYKYADSDLIPSVMSRLGGYFQSKGQAYKEQADPLREKTDVQSQAEVLRLDELSYPHFLAAALIFTKLQERFPDDELAGLAGLRAGQNYMRAHQYEKAIRSFTLVINNETYDGREIRAQALYWCGLSHERQSAAMGRNGGSEEAYKIYRRITFDFPDSNWAKFARGRLADPVFEKIILIETKERERMLEGLKNLRK